MVFENKFLGPSFVYFAPYGMERISSRKPKTNDLSSGRRVINMAKIVIIGGGVAGLSAGIYARLHGHDATVCERSFVAGGNLTGWRRGEYKIDNCIHWLTGTNPATDTYKMWVDLGALGDVEVIQGNSLYTCEYGGETLSLYNDLYRMEREMLEISPADEGEIRSLIRGVEVMERVGGIGGADHNEGLGIKQLSVAVPSLVKYYGLTTGELAKRFKHPLLRSFISSFWGEDFGALAVLMVFAYYCGNNGGIPRGGSVAMAERMTDRLREVGGELLLCKEAVRINCEDGRACSVLFSDGSTIDADYVVIATDPAVAFERLLDVPMPTKLRRQYNDPRMKRFSSYQCAFSYDAESVPFEGDLIFDTTDDEKKMLPIDHVIVREFSHERSFAPEGKSILQTMTFCSERVAKAFIKLRQTSKAVYDKKKHQIAASLAEMLSRRFPEMRGRLRCLDVWTPATYKRYTDSQIGSYMSFALPSRMIPKKLSPKIKGLSNVLLATQWLQAPGGLPIAAECGKIAIEAIEKLECTRKSYGRARRRIKAN